MSRAAVLLIDGFEETEAVTVVDVLRRADVKVDVLGVEKRRVVGSHHIALEADALLADHAGDRYQLVVLPGGMPGAARLRDHDGVQAFLKAHHAAGRLVAAICAAPIALGKAGVLQGKRATCYPGFEEQLTGADVQKTTPVVKDGNVITSRAPGTAMAFSLALVDELCGAGTGKKLAAAMLVA